ncbi:hypothetical protein [Actinophytocola sediminis]
MPEGYTVGLAAFSGAGDAIGNAVQHYGGLADELEQHIRTLRDNQALTGGFGVTGHFQILLAEFGREWLTTMDQFVVEERAFVEFLKGFATRLAQTQDGYRLAELRHAENFENISRSISER